MLVLQTITTVVSLFNWVPYIYGPFFFYTCFIWQIFVGLDQPIYTISEKPFRIEVLAKNSLQEHGHKHLPLYRYLLSLAQSLMQVVKIRLQ